MQIKCNLDSSFPIIFLINHFLKSDYLSIFLTYLAGFICFISIFAFAHTSCFLEIGEKLACRAFRTRWASAFRAWKITRQALFFRFEITIRTRISADLFKVVNKKIVAQKRKNFKKDKINFIVEVFSKSAAARLHYQD